MKRSLQNWSKHHPRAFYWRVLFPFQSALLCAYAAPLYGFNAMLRPIDAAFSGAVHNGWIGATAGGLMLMSTGFGALLNGGLTKLAGSHGRLLAALSLAVPLLFGLGALAVKCQSIALLLVFAILSGIAFSNIYSVCSSRLMAWARLEGRAGLQAGMIGLAFGAWGALNSFVAPPLIQRYGLATVLVGTGLLLMILTWLAWLLLIDAPAPSTQNASADNVPALNLRELFRLPPYWIYFAFFFLFLLPGFGFKIIIQQLSFHVFHASETAAQIMAVAFLLSYGVSRLVFGILSDKLATRPMYFWFTVLQGSGLLAAAITLPMIDSIVVFTVLMCFISVNFAAGKCIFLVTLMNLFGHVNFHLALRGVLPAYGLAGLLGACSLNQALLHGNAVTQTALWLYAMSAALAVCFVLLLLLKRVDYAKWKSHQPQPVSLQFRGNDSTRF